MTFLEKFKEDHPNVKRYCDDGTPYCCPYSVGYEADRPNGNCRAKLADCKTCWGREMPRPQTMKEKFFELFPNASPDDNGLPDLCPHHLGWKDIDSCKSSHCVKCWSQKVPEVGW